LYMGGWSSGIFMFVHLPPPPPPSEWEKTVSQQVR
jgi:hypothetical protein